MDKVSDFFYFICWVTDFVHNCLGFNKDVIETDGSVLAIKKLLIKVKQFTVVVVVVVVAIHVN